MDRSSRSGQSSKEKGLARDATKRGGWRQCLRAQIEDPGGDDWIPSKGSLLRSHKRQERSPLPTEGPMKAHKTNEDVHKVDTEFKIFVTKIFATNKLSAVDTIELVELSKDVGAKGFDDISFFDKSTMHKNAQRDLLRRVSKGSNMPSPYWVEIPVKDPDNNTHHNYLMVII